MTDQTTTPDQITPEVAEAELARLEQTVIEGGDVTVAELTQAKERISFARLFHQGQEARAEKKRQKEAAELREQTKKDVAKMFTGGTYIDPLTAYDQAVAALDNLANAIESNNNLLQDVYRAFSRGGVPVVGWDGVLPEGHDPTNTASVGQGELVHSVIVDGVGHVKENPAFWVRAATHDVARAHAGLSLPFGHSLEVVTSGDRPRAITERKV